MNVVKKKREVQKGLGFDADSSTKRVGKIRGYAAKAAWPKLLKSVIFNHSTQPSFTMILTAYSIAAVVWTLYVVIEIWVLRNVQGQFRPYLFEALITNLVLFPFAFVMSAMFGMLGERVRALF